METIIRDVVKLFDNLAYAGGKCSPETWGVMVCCLLIFGYFVLKGNPVRGG